MASTMKLRLRSLESKETIRIEVLSSCSLQELKETVSRAISSSSTLHLSLNKKDEIRASSPDETLNSIGITSGDLIFYTPNPDALSVGTLSRYPSVLVSSQIEPISRDCKAGFQESQSAGPVDRNFIEQGETEIADADMLDALPDENGVFVSDNDETMSVINGGSAQRHSEPCFLRKVLKFEFVNDFSDWNLMVLAIHSVFLDSGFVGLESISASRLGPSLKSLYYTLPEINDESVASETLVLKFRHLGHFIIVHGFLSNGETGSYKISLDTRKYAWITGFLRANSGSNDNVEKGEGYPQSEVFEFWKIVKDGLALPLLIDICEKVGLGPPTCFMLLPTELKLKILEYLPAKSIAEMGCVNSELKYLCSSNHLWKQKLAEEFGVEYTRGVTCCKDVFLHHWESRKKAERAIAIRPPLRSSINRVAPMPLIFRDCDPPLIGGDYDAVPSLFSFGQMVRHPRRLNPRRTFSPFCIL